eukprot:SAG31_NODE_19482_length_600_cov_1.445110_2_plen_65_part_01
MVCESADRCSHVRKHERATEIYRKRHHYPTCARLPAVFYSTWTPPRCLRAVPVHDALMLQLAVQL